MTIRITLKDPDAVYEAVQDALENETFGLDDEDEIETIRERRAEKYRELANTWFKYGEYLTVELDTDQETLTVLPVSDLQKADD